MKLKAEINAQEHEVEFKRDGDLVYATVDDHVFKLEISEPEPAVFLIKDGARVYEAIISDGRDQFIHVSLNGTEFNVAITDPKRLRGTAGEHSHSDELVEIKTAMPGKVVRILSKPGESVEKGAGVIVVEAMKMQNEMRSPRDGMVKEIRVTVGSTVNAGQVLVVIA